MLTTVMKVYLDVASATYIITPFNVDLMGDQLDDMESGEFHL